MKRRYLAILTLAVAGATTPAYADRIERACLSSGRAQATHALCGCIQDAADMTLTRRDQRKAATFFNDPHRAQEVRQSSRSSDSEFWERYRSFGDTAAVFCEGLSS